MFISAASINIYYGNLFLGDLVITFNKNRHISDDEMKFIKTLVDQAGIAIHQARLYEKEKQNTQREILLRNLTEEIRSSLDVNKTKKYY